MACIFFTSALILMLSPAKSCKCPTLGNVGMNPSPLTCRRSFGHHRNTLLREPSSSTWWAPWSFDRCWSGIRGKLMRSNENQSSSALFCWLELCLNCNKLCTYLSGSLSLNVAFEDLFGPGGHPEGRLDLLIILTHNPKLQVFITELWLQESLKYLRSH